MLFWYIFLSFVIFLSLGYSKEETLSCDDESTGTCILLTLLL